jgi:hypothetical protein
MRIKKQDGSPKAVRLDPEDEQLLESCCKAEKLTYSDIIRHAVRLYAKHIGVNADTKAA